MKALKCGRGLILSRDPGYCTLELGPGYSSDCSQVKPGTRDETSRNGPQSLYFYMVL